MDRFFSGAAILALSPCLVKPRRRLGEQLLRLGWWPVNSRFHLSASES
ncbi:MAG: hypothetical protein AVDCRST_MAG27-1565 [uncultured Craurococcus sp.]|uniref:Uncharacterized protein n=1 Tax=uncultured Craurococcus sp. TaxID=1135998 RepID=A0A6J4I4G5_9PROT|nr:MAG: hypothetical protein AVDCRST_MAG27-1565 [uncultured Craurococcus sp.]